MKPKILLVDDEHDIIEFLQYNLEQSGFQVIIAYDGEEALNQLDKGPDVILLDIMMPKLNGYEVFKRIRSTDGFENVPIIFLTAKSGESDEIAGLELGASDYIQKPISPRKLVARVKLNLRKGEPRAELLKAELQKINHGPLTIDKERFIVILHGKEKLFPRKEFEILFYLAKNPGKVSTREQILKDVWGTDVYVVDRTVDVHIRKIREKLGKYSELIETVKGVGYRFKRVDQN